VSSDSTARYEFSERIPIDPIDAGSTILVAGSALTVAEELAISTVAEGSRVDEGMLYLSTNETATKLLQSCRRYYPELDLSRTAVLDCTGQNIGNADPDVTVRYVSTQSDLTGFGMKFSALYESLYEASPNGRVRIGMVSLSSLVMYVDLRGVFKFAQTIAGRIDSAGGLGVFSVDPSMHDSQTVSTLNQLADAVVEVRDPEGDTPGTADGELRVRGLRDQSNEWQPFELP